MHLGRACSAAAFASAALLALLWRSPVLTLPVPTGPYPVGTRTLHLTDPQTHRELVTQLWYPAQPTGPRARYMRLREIRPLYLYLGLLHTHSFQDPPFAPSGGPFPLLLFNHAWGARRTQNTLLAEDLASHGFVVVSLDHPGNSARIETSSGRILVSDRAHALDQIEADGSPAIQARWLRELDLWTRDDQFVLTQLLAASATPGTWLSTRLDPARLGAFGHSFGGAVAMRLLGLPGGPRIRSALNLDGWTLGGLAHRTTEPVLFVYTADEEPRRPPVTQEDQLDTLDNAEVDRTLALHGGSRTYLPGAAHLDFTDAPLVTPRPRPNLLPASRIRELTRTLTLAFFSQTLTTSSSPLAAPPAHASAGSASGSRSPRARSPQSPAPTAAGLSCPAGSGSS